MAVSDPYLTLIVVFLGIIALAFIAMAIVALSVGRRIISLLWLARSGLQSGAATRGMPLGGIIAAIILALLRRKRII